MAKFDVYPDPNGHYWLDCQADTFSALNSRFVVPLQAAHEVDGGDRKLNPRFVVLDDTYVMMTHFAGAVPTSEIRGAVLSLVEHEYEIGAALDLLIGGY
jgi:toxin CcdB